MIKRLLEKVAGIYLGKDYDFTYLEDPIKSNRMAE